MKKIRLNKLFLSTVILSFLVSVSCTDGFENTNPNEATDEMMNRDDLRIGSFFSQMLRNVFIVGEGFDGDYQITQNLAGDIYSGYMGACGLWYSNSNNTTYNLISNWYDAAFNLSFTNVMAPWSSIRDITKESFPQKYALATIVKVEGMHRIADMYGPLPYINFGSGSIQNPYDSQKDIYDTFFEELDEAIGILTDFDEKSPGAKALSSDYDFIYSGNVINWIKFANSLKLRLAMRIAYADPGKARQEAESAVNHSVGVMTMAGDAAVLNKSSRLSYRHPLYVICYEFTDVKMGATMDSYLNGYNDPRISSYFVRNSADGVFRGIRTGIQINNKADYAEGPFSMLNVTPESAVVWMNAAEVYFLRAEGALRGWNMGGAAQELYETGVRTSFSFLGAGNADGYLADGTSMPVAYTDPVRTGNSTAALGTITVKWDETAIPERNLERIITQKWIATYPDGQEAWSEFRRTGYPKIFPVVVNNSGGKISSDTQIRRLPFPSTEYRDNSANMSGAVNLLGGADTGGTKLWWDKK
ncbi:MAG: RagB/SusD family nutrient uptake outer membrane protein [Mangrovibacterium sp.]